MNIGEMQRKLSQWAEDDQERKFKDLYSLLCNIEWLRVAHKKVNSNRGRETAGIDRIAMWNFNENLDNNLDKLREELKAKTFEPCPVLRVYIPKPNGKERPLGIPTIKDRIVQEALRMVLEPIWEADFSNRSYGFRPNRSTYDAISYIGNHLTGLSGKGYQWVIEGDISSYFDTIPHRRLNKAVKKRVADKDIRDLLWNFLRAGVMYRGKVKETLAGTPQGGIVSPLLANIYLDELDKYMESNYLDISYGQRSRRREKGKSNFLYVRYADDFVVLCNGTKEQAQSMKDELKDIIKNMGLTLSEEKTKITHITEGFTFLGYKIIRSLGKSGKMVPKVLIPASAVKRFQHKTREILTQNSTKESTSAKIIAQNRLTTGWCQYYRCTSSPGYFFEKLRPEVYWNMAHWLGRKYKLSISEVIQKYGKDNTFVNNDVTLIMPSEYKAKKLMTKTWHNPYTGTENIEREHLFSYAELWTGTDQRQNRMDLREEVIELKGTTCMICGINLHPSEVQVDHIKRRATFKDPRDADQLSNMEVLCTLCHREKTKIERKVLSRMP